MSSHYQVNKDEASRWVGEEEAWEGDWGYAGRWRGGADVTHAFDAGQECPMRAEGTVSTCRWSGGAGATHKGQAVMTHGWGGVI